MSSHQISLPISRNKRSYFDPVKKSGSSLSFNTDDQIKDCYTRYRDNRLSKETLSEIKKDLPIPNIDDLVHPN